MLITRTSLLTGDENTLEIDVTDSQIAEYNSGVLLQKAFPNLDCADREFIKSGITPEEWNQIFGKEPA
jgi:hypothetical protein